MKYNVALTENERTRATLQPKTRHYRYGGLLPAPKSLQIWQLEDGFYLFYLDEDENEQTDTHHDTVEQAFRQAEFEFGIPRERWTDVSEADGDERGSDSSVV